MKQRQERRKVEEGARAHSFSAVQFQGSSKAPVYIPLAASEVWRRESDARNVQVKQLDSAVYSAGVYAFLCLRKGEKKKSPRVRL